MLLKAFLRHRDMLRADAPNPAYGRIRTLDALDMLRHSVTWTDGLLIDRIEERYVARCTAR